MYLRPPRGKISAMKVYTKTGDLGSTSLFGGHRVPKSHIRIESYGTVDELNSYIGWIRDQVDSKSELDALSEVQDRLFTIGSHLATDSDKLKESIPDLIESDVEFLESEIDRMEKDLPELKYFILPGGHPTVSLIHVSRCVCRRAERYAVRLQEVDKVEPLVIKYLNRLSDYLFVLARKVGNDLNAEEVAWTPRKT